ncbi:MAG: helix-turn-helix transcriptional regulator [Candidatus Improbicoccus devescovinae]|nr:MAG: helix-turn-helix transcriptional regulator [Candidatus Improbicoccus devescovinae]GMB10687.1 MAG: helix-turn-helix transcriptional regulator [Candidatus Improbicoccus devescovinae]
MSHEKSNITESIESTTITIGQRLKEIRLTKGLTTKIVSEKSGIHMSKIRFYEIGNCVPTIYTLQKLATGLECTIFDIIDKPLGRDLVRCIHSDRCIFYNKEFSENKK